MDLWLLCITDENRPLCMNYDDLKTRNPIWDIVYIRMSSKWCRLLESIMLDSKFDAFSVCTSRNGSDHWL